MTYDVRICRRLFSAIDAGAALNSMTFMAFTYPTAARSVLIRATLMFH